jgi:predicted nucleic acid-binding protein
MDLVLLDTDVFSMFLRRDARSLRYDDDVRGKIRCLCFASVAELRFGAIAAGWGDRRRQQREDAIGRAAVLPADDSVTLHWAQVKAARGRVGRPIASEDCWVAATALRHGIPLVTHNARHYQDIPGLNLISRPDPEP